MRYLEQQGIGYEVPGGIVPIVPGAILFDLDTGAPNIRPNADMGYAACQAASDAPVLEGSVGAGTGAVVGRILGKERATKGGIGSASIDLGDGLIVAALIAVNSSGDILDEQGQIIAGVRQASDSKTFADMLVILKDMATLTLPSPSTNTVIGVVATTANLTKDQVNKVAQMAQNGLARSIRPAHTPHDGDTIFVLATGTHPANPAVIGTFAAEVTTIAIRRAITQATSLGGVPAINDL